MEKNKNYIDRKDSIRVGQYEILLKKLTIFSYQQYNIKNLDELHDISLWYKVVYLSSYSSFSTFL